MNTVAVETMKKAAARKTAKVAKKAAAKRVVAKGRLRDGSRRRESAMRSKLAQCV
jgi:hypothetical protein